MFNELIEYCKAIALKNAFIPTEDSVWKSICRTYSKTFHTPLHQVLQLDPEHVILAVLEDRYDGIDMLANVESFLDQIYALEDPNYRKQQNEDMDVFAQQAEELEQKRINKNNQRDAANKKALSGKQEPEPENKPTGGSVDFSGLKNEDPGKF